MRGYTHGIVDKSHVPLLVSTDIKACGHFKRGGCPWRSPAQTHLTLSTKPSFSPAADLQLCSSPGIFSILAARQHQELPKASPRVGAESVITTTVIWYWAMNWSPPSAAASTRGFFWFICILKDQHPSTAERSSAAARDAPRERRKTINTSSCSRQSHPTWKRREEPRTLRTATTYDYIEAFLLLWLR